MIFADEGYAALSAMLFCSNPASVFHSAVYSESVFALLTYSALVVLSARPLFGAGLLALATAARSNGIVACIFVAHTGLKRLLLQPKSAGKDSSMSSSHDVLILASWLVLT